ncbi:MAG: tautomerase family protein [Fluviibacter sp.]
MPFIRISLAGAPPTQAQLHQLQAQTTKLMAEILGKRPEVTVVAVESIASPNWSVGGQAVSEVNSLAQMEAFITAGTNTEAEKSAFIEAAYQMLCSILSAELSPVYVLVIEVDHASWGYDGKTQAYRKQVSMQL